MKTEICSHHSISDFDKTNNAVWRLSDTEFISAPTSLAIGGSECQEEDTPFLCKIADTLDLPEGQLETLHTGIPSGDNSVLYFRNQRANGGSNAENTYSMRIRGLKVEFRVWVAGIFTDLDEIALVTEDDRWYRDRITWWNGLDPHCDPALVIMFERYTGPDWTQIGEWLYDTNNRWKTSGINRCGPGGWQMDDNIIYIDNTRIFKPS